MNKFFIAIFLFTVFFTEAFGQNTYTYPNGDIFVSGKQSSARMATQTWASPTAYIYLPPGYDNNSTKTYPLIFSFHGVGENGGLTALLGNGLPDLIDQGIVPFSVNSQGDTTRFIVFSLSGYSMTSNYISQIESGYYFLQTYYRLRIDTNRVYASGYSAGGAQALYALWNFPNIFAAAVPMSTQWNDVTAAGMKILANKPIWQLHGSSDVNMPTSINLAIDSINAYNNENPQTPAVLTAYPGGHCCWNTYYNPTWKWTVHNPQDIGGPNNLSIYDWMLQYTLSENSRKGLLLLTR